MTNKTDVVIVNNELAAGRQSISAWRPGGSALLTALALGLIVSVAALGQADVPRVTDEATSSNVNPLLEWNQIFIDTLIATNTANSSSQRLGAILHTAIFDAYNGIERRYTPIELFELIVLADLRQRGFTVHQLHQILLTLREQFQQRLFDATGGGGSVQLLTDGREIYARTSSGAFYNLLKSPGQPLLVIGNEGLLKALGGKARARKKVKPKATGLEKSSRGRPPAAE
jgi:hypothetical protein